MTCLDGGTVMSNRFSIIDGKKLNIDQIEGRFAAFERVPYAVTLRLSKPLAEDGYGVITVNGTVVPQGKSFFMDMIIKCHCLMVPVGSAAREYGKKYTMHLSGFKAADGSPFPDTDLHFETLPRPRKDDSHAGHDEIAIQAAREGMVLLKNAGGVLPLKPGTTLNCFGAAQFVFRNTATGAGLINPRWQANFHQSIKEHSSFRLNEEVSELYSCLEDICPADEVLVRAQKEEDTALILITRGSGEFLDNRPVKGGYYLTDEERAMICKVSGTFSRTIAILNTGYPIEMGWIEEYGIDTVLYTGFAGMGAGYALMEILDGRCCPSGKLPDTWALDYYDYPSAHNFPNLPAEHKAVGEKEFGVQIYYEEDIYVGYRYFDTFSKKNAYCFGHGLSYTDFELSFSECEYAEGILSTKVRVSNIGRYSGKEVVQLYVEAPAGKLEKPRRVLAAFGKTKELAPGASEILTLTASDWLFSSYDEDNTRFVLEPGVYTIWGGASLENSRVIGSFTLDNEKVSKIVHRINPPVEKIKIMTRSDTRVGEDTKIVPFDERISKQAPRPSYSPLPLEPYHGKRISWRELKDNPKLLDHFVAQMSTAELCRMNVCGGADWYMPWQSGAAGKTVALKKYKMPRMTVSDGNTGLNLKKRNIGFPSSCTVAASFNKDLAYQVGCVIAEEAKELGINLNLGPAMNVHRNILNGRHPEYFSEDPCLSGIMAANQGKGLEENGCGCTYKHLFCNGSDTSRKASQSIVSERALREIYFKTFEIAMSIHQPGAVMTSYNAVNGIYPAENADILQTLLREEWGFEGFVMTDWGTYDTVDAVEMVKAGNCWLTEGKSSYTRQLQKAVKAGRLSRAVLEQNVKWLIKAILRWTGQT